MLEDQGVHPAERVLPVGIGEIEFGAIERVDDHSARIVTGLVVEIGGVDQAGRDYTADVRSTRWHSVHTMCLPVQEPLWKGLRGRDQCSRTVCPGRVCAILSMSSSTTTPITG